MIEVNMIAVLLAGVASMAVGFLWYSPLLFAKPWTKLMGYTQKDFEKEQKKMGMMYGLSFVLALVTAYVLSHVMALSMNFYSYAPVSTGTTSAFWMWLGFVMPVQATDVLFGKKVWKLFYINTGYQLASLLTMGVVLGTIA